MRVAAVQFRPTKGDKFGALNALIDFAEQAGRERAELIVMPEMAATGYVFRDRRAVDMVSEPARGETFAALAPVAKAHRSWIVCGIAERDADKRFNSAIVIDPSGVLRFTYRKTMLYELDRTWAEVGDSGYAVFDAVGGRFTVGICMDLNDDRFTGWCETADARAIAFPTNWLDQGRRIWDYWLGRLERVPSALIAANTWGVEENVPFRGESAILDGHVVRGMAPRRGDALVMADLPRW